ncbi:hypothetical protein FT663_04591 [Candidozyma haemuli var. vulneris]|uniref:Mitochondrial import inner membrane translocase subunit TIM54 n=1 Tax=Candidozyma haemuli TaxID=45357 RepID=A0A2V1ALB5_9ASCO|nr:hypothetical protein CXQ85_000952 [[Candida] haemuloni]KAF3986306.1 hypothetical protein FT662_04637 [[Candida] haemuloni var. vulneris]KAF3987124.1 hypothetical protein FT663_04591 [[Candida] haemuloni var. vulneris]PVH18669.1 hypothetical protein CXQ85_000952 [[Candida] haemuloni]
MSEGPEKPDQSTKPKAEASGKPATPPKKGWSNPALRAMGIPRISLPSRNWMIFWTALAGITGGIAYDKYQQKQIRKKYMQQVEQMSQEIYTADRVPRRLTVFIAPPPNDFLQESLKHFRRYVKPVLNAAAIDFTVFTEERQGDIRTEVAGKIRQLRKERLEAKRIEEERLKQEAYDKSWKKFFTESVPKTVKGLVSKEEEPEVFVSRQDLYSSTDLLGLYKVIEPIKCERDDSKDVVLAGGVLCIGRGTYKEYLTGVHEGLLGPLDAPPPPPPEPKQLDEVLGENKEKSESETPLAVPAADSPAVEKPEGASVPTLDSVTSPEGDATKTDKPEEKSEADDIDDFGSNIEKSKLPPVPKPYISPSEYAQASLAPELNMDEIVRNDKNVPVLFEQPIGVFTVPKLSGVLNIPTKIYRYYTKRYLAEDVAQQTLEAVYGHSRPYDKMDRFLAAEEELDWPKKWIERGKKKNSEWVQELEVDPRVIQRMRVFSKSEKNEGGEQSDAPNKQ